MHAALRAMECVIVQDLFLNETAKFAHVFLPGSSFLEKSGTFTNAERRISPVRQVMAPLGGYQDWQVTQLLANAMGYSMNYSHPSEIMDEIARLTPSFAGVSYEKIDRMGSVQWPCNDQAPEGTPTLHDQQNTVERWQGNSYSRQLDYIAEEAPVSLVYNGLPHVVMLATPTNLEDFALGFSITEGIVQRADEMLSTRVYQRSNGIEVRIRITEQRFRCLADKGRNLTGRTGCGLCGASNLEQAIRPTGPVRGSLTVPATELFNALDQIRERQTLNQLTGAVHAAAWVVPGQGIQQVREDVGRHNALDKLIGLLLRAGKNPADGFLIMTSRASYELVQKAATVGITLLAAISAPTGLAIRLAEDTGLTLVGFARDDQYVVYSHAGRLTHTTFPTLLK